MAATTVYLGVLIIALIIGNALLFLLGRKKRASFPLSQKNSAVPPVQVDSGGEEPSAKGKLVPLEKKIELAHRRIQELEQKLDSVRTANGSGGGAAIKKKIEKLDSFRSIAESELIAIKEILMELQNKNITVKARTYKGGKKKPNNISREDLHRIIYRSSS